MSGRVVTSGRVATSARLMAVEMMLTVSLDDEAERSALKPSGREALVLP